jgi:hypothetical protein
MKDFEFTAEILRGPFHPGDKIPVFSVLNITSQKAIYVGISERLSLGVKRGNLVLLKGKELKGKEGFPGFRANSCAKIYSDKVRDVLGE